MNQGWTYRDKIGPQGIGQTLLDYYCQRYRHSERAQWQARIEQGQILLDGQRADPLTRLTAGQQLTYHRPPWQEPAVPLVFEVLYEDEHLWAIAKPSGLPVLPGGGFLQHTLLHQLRLCFPQAHPVPVHRLGRGTSGVMLVAKSPRARGQLARQFREQQLEKRYRALIGPCDTLADEFSCTYEIGKVPYPRLGYVYGHVPGGLPARSEGRILQRDREGTLVEVKIATGRPHQIRIHLAAAGFPLLGDPLYPAGGVPRADGNAIPSDCGYWLHAHQLRFIHPQSGKTVRVVAPLPTQLRQLGE